MPGDDPLVAFARAVATDEAPADVTGAPVDPAADPGAAIRRAARSDPRRVREETATLVDSLDPAEAPHEAVRVLAVLVSVVPDAVAPAAPSLLATAERDDGRLGRVALDAFFDLAGSGLTEDARAAVGRAAERRSAVVAGRLRALVAGLRPDDATGRELRTLAALAPAAPGLVSETIPLLIAVLEDAAPYRDAAAFDVLIALAGERPATIPLDRVRELASIDEYAGWGRAGRALTVLAVADEAAGAATLSDRCRQLEETAPYRLEAFLATLATDHGAAFPALAAAFAEEVVALPSGDHDEVLAALEDLALEDPAAIAPGADRLAPLVFDYRRSVRTTAARILHHVGRETPGALPAWARPLAAVDLRELRERPEAASDADATIVDPDDGPIWPLGGIAAERPEVSDLAADRLVEALDAEYHWEGDRTGAFVAELASGNPAVAGEVAGELASVAFERWADRDHGAPEQLLVAVIEACPAVAADVARPFVRAEARGRRADVWYMKYANRTRSLLAEHAPDAFRAAIEAEYGGPAAYVEQEEGATEPRREVVVELFEEYDATWSDVNTWLSVADVRESIREGDDDEIPDGPVAGRLYRLYATVALWVLGNLVIAIGRYSQWVGLEDEE